MDATRVEASSHWFFSERVALRMGRQRRDAFAEAGRTDIRVQIFRKTIISPTKRQMSVELIKHALQVGIFTALKRECGGCALKEPLDSDGHNCAWPQDATALSGLVQGVSVDAGWYGEKINKITEVMANKYTPAHCPEFGALYDQAKSDILQGVGGSADLAGLFGCLEQYSAPPAVNLLAAM